MDERVALKRARRTILLHLRDSAGPQTVQEVTDGLKRYHRNWVAHVVGALTQEGFLERQRRPRPSRSGLGAGRLPFEYRMTEKGRQAVRLFAQEGEG